MSATRKLRILVTKPGLDGHDRGVRVVARAYRDAGFEVIYTGLHQTPEQIVNAAIQEDVDLIAFSILSGAHLALAGEIKRLLIEKDAADITVIGGGIIPDEDIPKLEAMGVKKVVTTCPSCFHFWKHSYPAALGTDDLGVEVQHATEFLADLLETGNVKLGELRQNVTYHDPCDLGRKGGVIEAPRRVLAQIPGLRLVEMAENRDSSHCCGGGGNLESFAPEVGQAVARNRIRQAAEVGAGTLVSACQQCERTLANAARAERLRIRVKDITEVVLEAMEE